MSASTTPAQRASINPSPASSSSRRSGRLRSGAKEKLDERSHDLLPHPQVEQEDKAAATSTTTPSTKIPRATRQVTLKELLFKNATSQSSTELKFDSESPLADAQITSAMPTADTPTNHATPTPHTTPRYRTRRTDQLRDGGSSGGGVDGEQQSQAEAVTGAGGYVKKLTEDYAARKEQALLLSPRSALTHKEKRSVKTPSVTSPPPVAVTAASEVKSPKSVKLLLPRLSPTPERKRETITFTMEEGGGASRRRGRVRSGREGDGTVGVAGVVPTKKAKTKSKDSSFGSSLAKVKSGTKSFSSSSSSHSEHDSKSELEFVEVEKLSDDEGSEVKNIGVSSGIVSVGKFVMIILTIAGLHLGV